MPSIAVTESAPSLAPYLVGVVVAFVSALLLTPLIRDAAFAIGLVDPSDGDRKLHQKPVPRLGGVALVLSLALAGASMFVEGSIEFELPRQFLVILAGGLAMHVIGVLDDVIQMRARYKLMGQLGVAIAVCTLGVRVDVISLPGLDSLALPSFVGSALTVLWLVGMTNAFNLIDGVDGLAAGAAFVALVTMTIVGAVNQQWATTWVTLTLAGATLGLLVYNFHPASIFLGDSGSLFLGFMLAGLGLLSAQKSSTAMAVAIPLLVLGLPLLDTTLTIARRFLRGQAIFAGDRGHIHHRLLNQGYSPRAVALSLYGVCVTLGLAAFLLLKRPELNLIVLVLLVLGAGLFVHRLRIHEFEELAGTLLRTATQRHTIERAVRVREAASKIREAGTLQDALDIVAETSRALGFDRSELRLYRGFMEHNGGIHVTDARSADHEVAWSWRGATSEEQAWMIEVPLMGRAPLPIGCLRLWHRPRITEQSFSYWRAIGMYLCPEIARKLECDWSAVVPLPASREGREVLEPREPRESRDVRPRASGSRRAMHLGTHS